MRRRFSYANVAATVALVLSMSGGALAASHYLINSTKQINPKVLKKLKGQTGKTGARGATGATGATGAAGGAGASGKDGKTGEAGSALGYASVTATATLVSGKSKGVVSVTHPVTGLYCFDLSFEPNTAVASAAHITGNFKTTTETQAGTADVASFSSTCTAPNNDASVVIIDGELKDDQFYVVFN